jgi:hypothetical protein
VIDDLAGQAGLVVSTISAEWTVRPAFVFYLARRRAVRMGGVL